GDRPAAAEPELRRADPDLGDPQPGTSGPVRQPDHPAGRRAGGQRHRRGCRGGAAVTAAPVIRAASGGLFRRRLAHTRVIFVGLAASAGAATLGLSLLTNANEAFQNGFPAPPGAGGGGWMGATPTTRPPP